MFRSDMDETPLHYAAVSGSLEITKLLIDKKAEVNPKQKRNNEVGWVRYLRSVFCVSILLH